MEWSKGQCILRKDMAVATHGQQLFGYRIAGILFMCTISKVMQLAAITVTVDLILGVQFFHQHQLFIKSYLLQYPPRHKGYVKIFTFLGVLVLYMSCSRFVDIMFSLSYNDILCS